MIYQMDTEDILRLVAKYYSVHQILEDGPINTSDLKKRLMEEYHLPESTVRSYINAIADEKAGLLHMIEDTVYTEEDEIEELEFRLETLFDWDEFDSRHKAYDECLAKLAQAELEIEGLKDDLGKTYMVACIANALIDQENRVLMTDFATISNISIFDSAEYVSSLSSYDLLIIDDYGAERNSQFALQNVFDVINRRWESGKPLIVTTNLELDSIRNVESDDITRARINDRILEMCKPIYMGGDSKRAALGKQKMSTLKEVFSKGGNENE